MYIIYVYSIFPSKFLEYLLENKHIRKYKDHVFNSGAHEVVVPWPQKSVQRITRKRHCRRIAIDVLRIPVGIA